MINKLIKKEDKRSGVRFFTIQEDSANQRIDNFLFTYLKEVPKSHIYKLIRKGEIRVNKKRVAALYKLQKEDILRLPPLVLKEKAKKIPPAAQTIERLRQRIVYEDDRILVLNKPSGISVHAGSTVRLGIIEMMRHLYPHFPNIELAHRLDSETSGCLIIAKKKSVLRELHQLLRAGQIKKTYWAFTQGVWKTSELRVTYALQKEYQSSGKHLVKIHDQGKSALTVFHPLKKFKQASLMQVQLYTGRTHQIRVHAAEQKHPIALDDRYGDKVFNKFVSQLGLKRMFLHAYSLEFHLSSMDKPIKVIAPLDSELQLFLQNFEEKFNEI